MRVLGSCDVLLVVHCLCFVCVFGDVLCAWLCWLFVGVEVVDFLFAVCMVDHCCARALP